MTDQSTLMPTGGDRIIDLPVGELMERSYLNYAVSTIVDRSLPDVRDGLKPVHRRALYAMHELHLSPGQARKKSARVVGDMIGKYHPHGDTAAYDTIVRMAQPFTLLHPLVDGQGNFGSLDGDSAAAMRYTEVRMTALGDQFFEGLARDAVDFTPNYDNSLSEPALLPVPFPHLLVNGAEGIAVGMATSIPPHNLSEIINACLAWMEDPAISTQALAEIVPGPDFPTGGVVHGLDGYAQAVDSGAGRVRLRAKWHAETQRNGRTLLVIDEVPYRVNKANLVAALALLAKGKEGDRRVEDITAVADLSDKDGVRIVIELAPGADAAVVFHQLLVKSRQLLEVTVSYNMMALIGQQPRQMGFREMFEHFVHFRQTTICRIAAFDLDKARARLHILEGLLRALDAIDEVVRIIRSSAEPQAASQGLMAALGIDAAQAKAILDLRLQRLTGLERDTLRAEHAEVTAKVADLSDILASPARQRSIVAEDLRRVQARFGTPRRTEVSHDLAAITREDLVPQEAVLIPITQGGYIRRMPATDVQAQRRGTRGKRQMGTGEDDVVTAMLAANTHDTLFVFTDQAQALGTRVFQIPEGASGGRGRHLCNVFDGLDRERRIAGLVAASDLSPDQYLLAVTEQGQIKRSALTAYTGALKKGGVIGMTLAADDRLAFADLCRDGDHVVLVTSGGRAIRFPVTDEMLRPMGRVAGGVRGVRLRADERVIGMIVLTGGTDADHQILCVGRQGIGKRTDVSEFPVQGRGGQGVIAFRPNRRSGDLVAARLVTETDDLVFMTAAGVSNRMPVSATRLTGRDAAGTILMALDTDDYLVDVVPVLSEDDPEDAAEEVRAVE